MPQRIRVLLADDHAILREGLRLLLTREPDIAVVAEAADGHAAIRKTRDTQPDVVVMDISMPGLNGVDATLQIKADLFRAHVLCLSAHREEGLVAAVLQAGASGFVLKTGVRAELVEAIRAVARGEVYLSPPIAADVVSRYVRGNADVRSKAFQELTTREREVLQLIAEGHTTKAVANLLSIGEKTVLAHRRRVMHKLDVDSTVGLARYALREGISEL